MILVKLLFSSDTAESLAAKEFLEAVAAEDPILNVTYTNESRDIPTTVICEMDSEQVAYTINGHQPQAVLDAITRVKLPLGDHLTTLINSRPLMLFIKGTPEEPRCGFTRQLLECLRSHNIAKFGHFDILRDERVRQGLKLFADWPTYPQIYWRGELLGGLDIIKEQLATDCKLLQALQQQ